MSCRQGYVVGTEPYEIAEQFAVADECIRQMHWTLAMTTEAYMLAAGPPNDVVAAPDDWEVPK